MINYSVFFRHLMVLLPGKGKDTWEISASGVKKELTSFGYYACDEDYSCLKTLGTKMSWTDFVTVVGFHLSQVLLMLLLF